MSGLLYMYTIQTNKQISLHNLYGVFVLDSLQVVKNISLPPSAIKKRKQTNQSKYLVFFMLDSLQVVKYNGFSNYKKEQTNKSV